MAKIKKEAEDMDEGDVARKSFMLEQAENYLQNRMVREYLG